MFASRSDKEAPPAVVSVTSPFDLLVRDVRIVFSKLRYFHLLLWPFFTKKPEDELYLQSLPNILSIFRFVFLTSFYTLGWVGAIIIALGFGIAPASVVLLPLAVVLGLITWWILSEEVILEPQIAPGLHRDTKSEERWFFVNGIGVNRNWFNGNSKLLAEMFQRPITPINNKSLGFWLDLVQSIIQRDLEYFTQDGRVCYQVVKDALMEDSVKKIVLLGHSQGGIIVSLVIDRLLAEVPPEKFEKLEVYTFASAANHMNNPGKVIRHMEHYANEYDFVSQIGVLHFHPRSGFRASYAANNAWDGTLFINKGATGHLLNQHYLHKIFNDPLLKENSRLCQYLGGGNPS